MGRAKAYIEQALVSEGALLGPGGFIVYDVHSQKSILNAEFVSISAFRIVFCEMLYWVIRGVTDFNVTPYKTDVISAMSQAALVFLLKTEERVNEETLSSRFQPQALLSFSPFDSSPNCLTLLFYSRIWALGHSYLRYLEMPQKCAFL